MKTISLIYLSAARLEWCPMDGFRQNSEDNERAHSKRICLYEPEHMAGHGSDASHFNRRNF